MIVGLDVYTFARKVSSIPFDKPIPMSIIEEQCRWLYGSDDGYQMYADILIGIDWVLDTVTPEILGNLPSHIQFTKELIYFPTLKDVFNGMYLIYEAICHFKRLDMFEDQMNMFKACVERIDEITCMENTIQKFTTMRIKSSRPKSHVHDLRITIQALNI
jgi:hypothetical protein